MYLPPELINHILGHLSDDPESLRAMALVSKAWVSWCQAHLFKSVHLRPHTAEGWFKNVPHEVEGPASHTRALTLEGRSGASRVLNPRCPKYFTLSNLASFSNVGSLSFISWEFRGGASLERHFDHFGFGKSLRAVSLLFCRFDPAVFFDFLSLLPNVDDLDIGDTYTCSEANETIPDIPETTPNFCGTLSLGDLYSPWLCEALATLPLRFSTIEIKNSISFSEVYQPLFTSCRDTLVTLRLAIQDRLDVPLPDVSLASCNELMEVHVRFKEHMKLPRPLENLFSSITSQKLRKISLTPPFFTDENFDQETESENDEGEGDFEDEEEWWNRRAIPWDSWDAVLSPLAQQAHKGEGTLTLQLNIFCDLEIDRLLPKFLGHGGLVDLRGDSSAIELP
ncbi:hypothetical protein BJ322DRAFT_1113410 [Thelephora terrestris]|uniref:F-box domain-containing protein n=1 Tax=Thelephora terrestris TaxID=56493 RepID=A0A9P6H5D9_9AGAM|nr:hypothetical protein BJ322DRAFT_1113410 [Thelephora terrestris]